MKIRIRTERIAMVKHHRTGLVIDERMNWNKHIQEDKERVGKKLNLTKCLSHTTWVADQKTLLKIHQMIILSMLRYGGAEETRSYPSQECDSFSEPSPCAKQKTYYAGLPTLTKMRDENTGKIWIGLSVKWEKEHQTIYSTTNSKNWSKKDEKVGYGKDKRTIINIQRGTRSHHTRNTEATNNGGREVILTDLLSTMMAASGNNHTKNSKTRKIRQLMDKRKENVTLGWVPGHAGVTWNEEVDEEVKQALEESISNDEKYPPEDLSGQPTKKVGKRGECNEREK
jgi:hypothetical protein